MGMSTRSKGNARQKNTRTGGFKKSWLLPVLGATAAMIGCVGYGYPGSGPGSASPYPGGGYYPPGPGYGSTVRCESSNDRTQYCDADTRGGVRLSRRLSDAQCIQGRSWGYDSRRIWVSRGCRAEFITGTGGGYDQGYDPGYGNPGYGNGQALRCESNDNRYQHCDADTRGGVRLGRRLSDAQCVQGRTWGYDNRGIWVSGGCRGEFILAAGGGAMPYPGNPGSGLPRSVRCESTDNRYHHCNMDTRGGVGFDRQLSETPCVQGRSWGYDNSGVWVTQGCRAEFSTGSGSSRPGYGNTPGYGNGQIVRCESQDGRMRRCGVRIGRGVQLIRQLSDTRCVERQSWGWDRSGIWVNNGCRAEFRVY